jgi:hypothetical protein
MKIEDIRLEQHGSRARLSANITWEDNERGAQELYFETEEEFADALSCNPHAFLVACIMPAMRYNEKRLSIKEEICPELKEGLTIAMGWFRHWYDHYRPEQELVRIEAKVQKHLSPVATKRRAGFFFSGGIDSLATLVANRNNYPLEHPGSIKYGLLVCGFEVQEPTCFIHVNDALAALAEDAGIELIPVYTNLRSIGPEDNKEFWNNFWIWRGEFMGAAFASIAHAFSNRLSVVSINSTYDIPNMLPLASHPLIDPNYSSSDMRIRHDGIGLSRFTRTKLVAGWDIALRHLRVCNKSELYQKGMLNCGECEKCVRTMLALLAVGVLGRSRAFPVNDITEDIVRKTIQLHYSTNMFYAELINPLSEAGRRDLACVIEEELSKYAEAQKKMLMRQKIAEFDCRHLGSSLRKVRDFIVSDATHQQK